MHLFQALIRRIRNMLADPVRGLRVTVAHAAGRSTRIRSAAGTLTLHDSTLVLD